MDGLAIALRAVWWRRGISAAVLLIAAFATGVAAASPIYLAAASDSILQHTLRAAPASATGTGIEVSAAAVGKPALRGLDDTITKALRGRELQRAFPGARRVEGIEYRTTIVGPNGDPAARVTAVFRQDACAHLRVLRGRCTTEQDVDGAMVSASTAAIEQWRVGQQVAVAQFQDPAGPRGQRDRAVRIVGIYAPTDPDGAYWYNSTRGYFGGPDRLAAQRRRERVPILEAMLVPESSFSRITARNDASVNLIADLGFDPDQVHPSVVASLRTQLDRFGTALAALPVNQRGFSGALVTGLRDGRRPASGACACRSWWWSSSSRCSAGSCCSWWSPTPPTPAVARSPSPSSAACPPPRRSRSGCSRRSCCWRRRSPPGSGSAWSRSWPAPDRCSARTRRWPSSRSPG